MIWSLAFAPVAVAALGALWLTIRLPSPKVIGAIQHFAAGIVFYAAGAEVLPETAQRGAIWSVVVGGGLGIAAMLALRRATEDGEGPLGLTVAAGINALVDGLVLGLGFAAGERQGVLLGIAIAIEFLFLGLAIGTACGPDASRLRVIATTVGVALVVPLGSLIAFPVGLLPGDWQGVVFAFGLVALLYLVTEELLVEAHEQPETAWGAAMFFVGFLALTVVDMLMAR
jgi:ZIP family zinc transporter